MTEEEIKNKILEELDKAERIWDQVKDSFVNEEIKRYSLEAHKHIPTDIPGFEEIKEGQGLVGNFIAMVVDQRNSTDNLLIAIKNRYNISQLRRVYYENTALNTLGLIVIKEYKGSITEFLGDGFLALFKADSPRDVYNVDNAATYFLKLMNKIVNPILREKYDLPPLTVGIGLAYSKAMVTIIGFGSSLFPKAIGNCVYRASKLSKGFNEILYDECLTIFWPKTKNGTISFLETGKSGKQYKAFKKQIKNEK